MRDIIERNYLEIRSLNDLNVSNTTQSNCSIDPSKKSRFSINKFFYKNIGKKHRWTDRLVWSDKEWI